MVACVQLCTGIIPEIIYMHKDQGEGKKVLTFYNKLFGNSQNGKGRFIVNKESDV